MKESVLQSETVQKPFEVWHDTPEEVSILRMLPEGPFNALPETVAWDGTVFSKKLEFHVTLVHKRLTPNDPLEHIFTEFIKTHNIQFERFTGELRSASTGKNRSIVARCEMSNLEPFFAALDVAGIKMALQPAHVTLYSLITNKGIGIDTAVDMENLPIVDLSTLSEALKKVIL